MYSSSPELKRTRTGRPLVSCAQCRRSKLRCDRGHPCSQCARKGQAEACSLGVTSPFGLASAELDLRAHGPHTSASQPSFSSETVELRTLSTAGGGLEDRSIPATSPVGQLSIDATGRSRFFGPAAAAHVLPSGPGESSSRIADHVTSRPPISDQRSAWPAFPLGAPNSLRQKPLYEELPNWDEWQRLEIIYWQASSWRFEPITRSRLAGVVSLTYQSAAGHEEPAPHSASWSNLGLCFSVLAIATLFDPYRPNHDPEAERYSQLAIECLGATHFMANISVDTLTCLHLHCCYLLNSKRPRTDEIYALVGLGMRMAIIAGFHRDGQWWGLADCEKEARRRIWWEILTLERINSNRFGAPPSLQPYHFDTLRPSDQPSNSFLYWRWEWDDTLHARIEDIQISHRASRTDTILAGDQAMRQFWGRLPSHLKPPQLASSSDLVEISPTARAATSHVPNLGLALQQFRLALHYNTGLLQLHRAGFAAAIEVGAIDPVNTLHGTSVTCIADEVSPNVIKILEHMASLTSDMFRHVVLWLDLFSCLVPLAALVIRCPRSAVATNCHHLLLRGLALLERAHFEAPCEWHQLLWDRGRKLGTEATTHLTSRWSSHPENQEELGAGLTDLANISSGASQDPLDWSNFDPPMGEEFDFDHWLDLLKGGSMELE